VSLSSVYEKMGLGVRVLAGEAGVIGKKVCMVENLLSRFHRESSIGTTTNIS
jgi:hypothetical protein